MSFMILYIVEINTEENVPYDGHAIASLLQIYVISEIIRVFYSSSSNFVAAHKSSIIDAGFQALADQTHIRACLRPARLHFQKNRWGIQCCPISSQCTMQATLACRGLKIWSLAAYFLTSHTSGRQTQILTMNQNKNAQRLLESVSDQYLTWLWADVHML